MVTLSPGLIGLLLNTTVDPAGLPVAERLIGIENVPRAMLVKEEVALVLSQLEANEVFKNMNELCVVGIILKLELEISKKILPTALTLTLAKLVTLLGKVFALYHH